MQLTVKQLKNREPGSGMAVIDREAIQELGVSSGDFVRIDGADDGSAIARVWPSDPTDAGQGVIRIDGQLRQAANVSIDDTVDVEPTEVEPAESVTIALPGTIRIRGDLSSQLRDHLVDQAVTVGQTVAFPVGFGLLSGGSGRRVPLTVVDTEPADTGVVQATTEIELADRSVEAVSPESDEAEGAAPAVTYEDIGGLDDELEQVREMIELPMRHPELFQTLGIEPSRVSFCTVRRGRGRRSSPRPSPTRSMPTSRRSAGPRSCRSITARARSSSATSSMKRRRTRPPSSSSTNWTPSLRNARK